MQIDMGNGTLKKLNEERSKLENMLYDLCTQKANIKGLKLKFIEIDSPSLTSQDLEVKEDEIPIYICDEMLDYEELFKRFGPTANQKIYQRFRNLESLHLKRMIKLRQDMDEYNSLSKQN